MTIAGAPRSTEEQDRLQTAFRELFEKLIAFNELIGMKIVSMDPAAPRIRFEMRPDLVGHYQFGRLHGGVISSVLDVTAGLALMCAIAEKHRDETTMQVMHRFAKFGTIDLRIDFLRPGNGSFFVSTARVTRLGGRIGSAQMTLENDSGTLIATGSAAFVIS